ncbi:MAG: hypothetical protein FVQ81_06430 [Candidatus Glassbacteria bacterium]|nr:hypothetical protein [Candidatus Glassbacteria bacterium]
MNEMQNSSDNRVFLERMAVARRFMLARAIAEAALWCAVVLSASALVMLIAERTFYLPAVWRILTLALVAASLLGVAAWRLTGAITSFGSLWKAAAALERVHPELKNRLSAALEFVRLARARFGQSTALMHAAVAQARKLLENGKEVRRLCERALRPSRKRMRVALRISAVLAAAFMLTGASDPLAIYRAIDNYSHPYRLLELERSFRILVRPGDKTILRGDSLQVRALGTIGKPGEMSLLMWQPGLPAQSRAMTYNQGQFEHTLTIDGIQNDISYCVMQDGTSSDTFNVTVTNNPFVTGLSLTYHYPPYTGLGSYTTTREKAIQGIRGSRVVIAGRSSNPLESAWIRIEPDSVRPAALHGERAFSDTLSLLRDGSYAILLNDRWGLSNSDTLVYPITVLADEPPAVAIRHPRGETDLNEEMIQPLVFELADDFGLSKLVLSWQRVRPSGDSSQTGTETVAAWRGRERPSHVLEQFNWDLSGLGLLPEDEVSYLLTVYDNDELSGPKSSSTARYRIRFPSLEEIFNREQDRQEQIATDLEELEQQGEQLHEQVKKLNETLERGQLLQWEDNQQISQAVQEQRQMLEKVKKLSEKLAESIEQMQRGEMMSTEMLEKMSRVQELMNEVATDKFKELMSRIQQSIDRMDRRALEEAMEQLQISQEEILQKLDKTLALLERLQLEQQLDNLVRQTGQLAESAAEMADSTAAMLDPDQLARADSLAAQLEMADGDSTSADTGAQQDQSGRTATDEETGQQDDPESAAGKNQTDTAEDSKDGGQEKLLRMAESTSGMQEQAESMFEQIGETARLFGEAGELETAVGLMSEGEAGRRQPIEQSMEQAIEGYRSGQPRQSYEAQRRLKRNMQDMNERMQQYRENLQRKWRAEVAEAMKRAFDQLNFLSENQEDLIAEVEQEPDFNHPDILAYAAREQEIVQGLDAVRMEIVDAAKDNFFISNRLLSILYLATSQGEHSTSQLEAETRRKAQAMSSLERSLTTINAGMLTLLQDDENLQQSSSGTGLDQLMKQLEEMAQRQQQLNQMSRDAMNQQGQGEGAIPGPGTTSQGQGRSEGGFMEMLRRMAAEQEAIRRQLQEMAERMKGRRDMMGNALEGAAQEAEEVVKQLQEQGISRETLERQNRIFNRLLDAQKSIQERESGRRRKAERPENFMVVPPDGLPDGLLESGNGDERLRRQLERWQGSYPESYRNLIRQYYELLRARELEQQ